MGLGDEAIEDGIGDGGFGDVLVRIPVPLHPRPRLKNIRRSTNLPPATLLYYCHYVRFQ